MTQNIPQWLTVLQEIDFELMLMEDYMHGSDGKKITELRAKIAALHNPTEEELRREAEEWVRKTYITLPDEEFVITAYIAGKASQNNR